MTIYVDEIHNWGKRGDWCHMMTDGDIEELHKFALRIGLKRSWFQPHPRTPHYDLRPSKRALAIQRGAEAVSSKEMLLVCTFRQDLPALTAEDEAALRDDQDYAHMPLFMAAAQ